MKLIRVAVIGCGVIAQNVHIPAYIQNPKSKLVAICDSNTEQMEKVKKRYDIANTFSDYKELVDSDLVDAVTICTPSATHSEIALETIKHGIHTLCEKPLASTLSEGEKIAAAVRQGKAKFMVGFNYRFLPNHVMAKKFLDAGRIGKPIFIRGDLITAGPYRTETRERDYPYEVKKRIGALFDLGSHIADLFIWMMGQPREVYATFSSYKNTVNADDLATVLVKFESGVLGNINVTWLNLPDYQSTADNRIIEIVGTEGLIGSEFYGPSLFFYGSNSITSKIKGKIRITPHGFNPRIPDEALKWSYKREVDLFLESIIRDVEPPITAEHALSVLRLVVSAYDSARQVSAKL